MSQDVSINPENAKVSVGAALAIFLGSLVVAMIATVAGSRNNPFVFAAPWLFPMGLAVFERGFDDTSPAPQAWFLYGYALYAVFLGLLLKVRRRPAFYGLVLLYTALLLVNVAGCRHQNSSFNPGCFDDKSISSDGHRFASAP